jgi:hypothetical protein
MVPCTIERVLTGDTLLLGLRLGWGITLLAPCRLAGIMAFPPDSDEGVRQRQQLREACRSLGEQLSGVQLTFTCYEMDQHGRGVGQLIVTDAQGDRHDLAAAVMEGDG